MTSTKEVAKGLLNSWESLSQDLSLTRSKINRLEVHKATILSQIETLLKTFEVIGEKPKDLIVPPELMFEADSSIGDSIAKLLRERGPMLKTRLRQELEKGGKITTKNGRIILSNAIKRDGRKRFTVKDGVVYLKEKE